MSHPSIRIGIVGAGYFSSFHLDAWHRMPQVELVAICDLDLSLAKEAAAKYQIPRQYDSLSDMLEVEDLDAIDVISPPHTHLPICKEIAQRGLDIICQKPLAPTLAEANQMALLPKQYGVRIMVHENFRFQPWYRAINDIWQRQLIGTKLHQIYIRSRLGDGWQQDAYMARQPYFREMPRLLIYETGIHFVDVFRYLGGKISKVYAVLNRWNTQIKGEDAALIHFQFEKGGSAIWDANRYNEPNYPNPRYTFGKTTLEANQGTVRLEVDGKLKIQKLGQPETLYPYVHPDVGFAGDCVYATQTHFIQAIQHKTAFETDIQDYLENIRIQEAIYESARTGQAVEM